MPSAGYMRHHNVPYNNGIAMMMEQPSRGPGGLHRQTRTYGQRPFLDETPRDALARDVQDLRNIYQEQGLYTPDIRQGLQNVIQENKQRFPHLFGGNNGTQ
jgi:filamentous hemagglutinin